MLTSAAGRLFLVVVGLQSAIALAILLGLLSHEHWLFAPGAVEFLATAGVILVPAGVAATCLLIREQRHESRKASRTAELMSTVLSTSREWLWEVDADWRFTFSSPASATIVGYEPGELIGRHCGLVVGASDLAAAQEIITDPARKGSFSGLIIPCRHRDGSTVWVEASGRARYDGSGIMNGFEGTSRPLGSEATQTLLAEQMRAKIEAVLGDLSFTIAFQPIYDLSTGRVVGAEALTRFPDDAEVTPDVWFSQAASVGLGAELELAAVEAAFAAAAGLPEEIYVSVNLSPETCLSPRLAEVIRRSRPAARRIVLELTERTAIADYRAIREALAPLRRSGILLAVDDAGAGFASMRHILQLTPDIIKIDREIIAGIDKNKGQYALNAAMTEFAAHLEAIVVAEGIETKRELAAVTALGMAGGQGYLLGRPSTRPEDWAQWKPAATAKSNRPKPSS
jgi:PAS domain S-box-containing protein